MSSPADRPHPSRLRGGDHEREQAVSALGEHYANGRLTRAEHADRLDAAWSARTRADLDLLFHDLPVAGFRPTAPSARIARPGGAGDSGPSPWLVVLAVVGGVVLLSDAPVLLILLLVVGFVTLRRQRRRRRQLQGPPVWR